MKAVVFNEPGGPEVLHLEERPVPELSPNDVLVKVKSAGVNRPDVIQRKGKYPAPKGVVQDVLGLDVAGVIEAKGSQVKSLNIGDEVFALVPGGGYAEYAKADAGSCLPIPKNMNLKEAGAMPEVLFTVWHNLFQRGGLKPGENVLIYGGSGGIGSMAIQLAHLYGAKVATVASSSIKMDFCKELGADTVLNYTKDDMRQLLGNDSIDLILDCVGGKYLDINLDLLKPDGRLVYINAMNGPKPEFDIKKMMRKRLHITGSTLRARSYDFKKELASDIHQNGFPLLEQANFKNLVRYEFPLAEANKAHELMDSRDFVGKIILTNP